MALNWISVGDSPLLLFREGRVARLNADHSISASAGDSRALRSALAGSRIAMMDWRREKYLLEKNDIVVAASDGLWTLSTVEIAEHLLAHETDTAGDIAQDLLHLLTAKGSENQDNATLGVVKASFLA